METLGRRIVRFRIPILILSLVLLIPSLLGMAATRVNYDILYYLPDDIETMVGQDILLEDFGKGAFAMFVVEGMPDEDTAKLKKDIEGVDHVDSVIWYDTFADLSIPMEILPDSLYDAFNSDDCTLMAIFFDDTTSADATMDAIEAIRGLAGKQCFLSSMSSVVVDTRNLSNQETPIYVLIAVILSCLVLALTLESYLLPLLFLLSIGMAILYNMGSNYFLGEISYITKALSAVLQLGVTMDYSIFLWHSYQEQLTLQPENKEAAMSKAIAATVVSVVSSSLTTVAGFLALCFMSFTLGYDLGIVMAKGVVFGLLSCITVLPSLILVCDKAIQKTSHRRLLPDVGKAAAFIVKHYKVMAVLFLLLLGPAIYGNNHTDVYYKLDTSLPEDLDSIQANKKLQEEFHMNSTHMVLVDADMPSQTAKNMLDALNEVKGVKFALGVDSIVGPAVPKDFIPEELTKSLRSDQYQLILVSSEYEVATDEVAEQIDTLNQIIKEYDPNGMLIGEAPCTKDLITITNKDFQVVNAISIGVVFLIIMLVFRSISVPVILVATIEFAIFINMGIPYYTHTTLPFIASIVIGTIQLGATVDYAILMTTRYKEERIQGHSKREAVTTALSTSMKSIIVSATGFFAATFGVGLYSDIDMIGALCSLMARGALISMVVVILILPSLFMIFDTVICKTSLSFRKGALQ